MPPVRFLSVRSPFLLLALVVLLVVYPQLEGMAGRFTARALFSAVLLLAVYTVGTDRRHLIRGLALGVPAVFGGFLFASAEPLGSLPANLLQLAFLLFVISSLLGFLLRPSKVDVEKLSAAGAVYLLLGLVWTVIYRIVELQIPGSFALASGGPPINSDLIYFSYVTLTTLGYGDITPVSQYARSLAVLEAMTGTFFVAMLVARLMSLYGNDDDLESRDP